VPELGVDVAVTTGEVVVRELTEPHQPARSSTPAPAARSFEDTYRDESLGMVRLAFLMLGSRQQAEEVVQDAFAKLLERWDKVEKPAAYLRSCVVNGCRTAHRRHILERRVAARERAPVHRGLEADHLQDALAMLPSKRRVAIILRYYDDLSEAEIADVLGVRPGTVKSLVSRGLAQLREVVEQ
jgi:RNA polymerase sigma-70 factor (sigma-E family)